MLRTFEIEYDGNYYTIECEYGIETDKIDTPLGCRVIESYIPRSFKTYNQDAEVNIIDKDLKNSIWKACDRQLRYL